MKERRQALLVRSLLHKSLLFTDEANLHFHTLPALSPSFTFSDTLLLGMTSWHRKCQLSSAVMTFLEVLYKKMFHKIVF